MGNFSSKTRYAEIDGARYAFHINIEGAACIEQCKATSKCVHIPEALGGCPVIAIGDAAFSKLSCVENVICPCGLRHIGRHAFEGCLHLRSISLNEGLRSIGEEAFFLCPALGRLDVPASVNCFGPRPIGASKSTRLANASPFEVRFSPDNDRLFFDDGGVLYERREDGLVLVDGYRYDGAVLDCAPTTVEIGPRALSRMRKLEKVNIPRGLKRIGDEAFRGSTALRTVELPDTLASIGAAAFANTSIETLKIPASCTDIADTAFTFGSLASDGSVQPYRSPLGFISVDGDNPAFCMHGGLLCRRRPDESLEALLATALTERVTLGKDVSLIRDTAFAGCSHIDTMVIHDGVAFESAGGMLGSCDVRCVEAVFANGESTGPLAMPRGNAGRTALADAVAGTMFSAHRFIAAYDAMLCSLPDGLEKAKLSVARLAAPAFLSVEAETHLRPFLDSQLDDMCIAFGQRSAYELFDLMADAGLLEGRRMDSAVVALSARGDAAALGHLLDLKNRRLPAASWNDYEL